MTYKQTHTHQHGCFVFAIDLYGNHRRRIYVDFNITVCKHYLPMVCGVYSSVFREENETTGENKTEKKSIKRSLAIQKTKHQFKFSKFII